MNKSFWENKKVLVTGHTGFKGSWLSFWLVQMKADVYGYALKPSTTPSLFEVLKLSSLVDHCIGDVRNLENFKKRVSDVSPDIIIHMAAQPLVRYSYDNPVETYQTNVMGTVHLFEAVRNCPSVKVVLNITTDKCYDNQEWCWGYRENEPMGGYDPYSNSKGCSELVTSAYRNSYFHPDDFSHHGKAVATARAGNVVGGGDWADDRLIPDIVLSFNKQDKLIIRNPNAIRPWQHVLEPLSGYLTLAEKLWDNPAKYSGGWNFGPNDSDVRPVSYIADYIAGLMNKEHAWLIDDKRHPHEAHYLKLDISKAINQLEWTPRWTLDETLYNAVEWYQAFSSGECMREITLQQIEKYTKENT